MKLFLDECIDWRLARDIVGHDVRTARQMGWTTIANGQLLALASREFDVFVTVDRSLSFQKNLAAFPIAVIRAVVATGMRRPTATRCRYHRARK